MTHLRCRLLVLLITAVGFCVASPARVVGQVIPRVPNPPINLANLPGDLGAIPIPEPANLNDFVKDRAAAIRLGKALFWDMQVGSDGDPSLCELPFQSGRGPTVEKSARSWAEECPDAGCHVRLWIRTKLSVACRRLSFPQAL